MLRSFQNLLVNSNTNIIKTMLKSPWMRQNLPMQKTVSSLAMCMLYHKLNRTRSHVLTNTAKRTRVCNMPIHRYSWVCISFSVIILCIKKNVPVGPISVHARSVFCIKHRIVIVVVHSIYTVEVLFSIPCPYVPFSWYCKHVVTGDPYIRFRFDLTPVVISNED